MTLRVCFVGLGSIGQRHLRNLLQATGGDVEVSAVRNVRTAPVLTDNMQVRAGEAVSDFYDVREIATLEEAVSLKPDAVFVTNPSNLHVPAALTAINAGCPVFIEKPVSHSMEGVNELVDAAAASGAPSMVGYQWRFHPALDYLRDLIDGETLGAVTSAHLVNAEYMPGWHEYEDYRTSYAGRRDLGGGALVTQIHDFDFAYALFGLPEIVSAMGGKLSSLEIDVEDSVTTLLGYRRANGVVPVTVHLDYLAAPPKHRVSITFDRGQVNWDVLTGEIMLHRLENGATERHDFSGVNRADLFRLQISHFLQVLENKAVPPVSLGAARDSLAIALAAKKSMQDEVTVRMS